MEIKFRKSLNDYKYLVMIDLASHKSGVCFWDLRRHCPIFTIQLDIKDNSSENLYYGFRRLFQDILVQKVEQGVQPEEILVYKEAMPSQVGGKSTIQTFVALAKAHAILELFLSLFKYDTYDNVGVYPITTHAYYRKLYNLTNKDKVTKENIKEHVISHYNINNISNISLDETDAIFLAETFCYHKWNKDIDDEIKEQKRHKKQLKAQHAIQGCDDRINFLLSLKEISKEGNNG